MRKNIWMFCHYATNGILYKSGRHYWFAKYLKRAGYSPVVFVASTVHNTDKSIDVPVGRFTVVDTEIGVPFVVIKTPRYSGNGRSRIANMLSFAMRLFRVKKDVEKLYGKPDVIFASSVHPLVLFSGIHIAKKYRAPCVCEVRDLWPLSLVSYGLIKESSVLTKILFISEKWIYEKADSLIFTFEGGRQYIKDKGWDKSVDPEKVFHINNGVDLEVFNEWLREYPPCTLCGENGVKRIVYAGSIGVANDVGYIVDLAKAIDLIGGNNIRFDIYGDGEYLNALKKRCIDEDIKNIEWHGFVDRKYIPGIVSGAFANIIHLKDVPLLRYGISLNKLFDYLAAGKPIIETIRTGYDIIEKYDCGISMKEHDVGKLAKDVVLLSDDCKRYGELSVNALKATEYYSFDALTKKLIKIVEGTRRLDGWKNRRN